MRSTAVSSVSSGGPKEEGKYSHEIKRTEIDDYDYENEGRVINLKFPKIVPLGQIKRSTYKYKRVQVQIIHPYRVMSYESAQHQRVKITCTYEGPTVDGKPQGLGFISYTEGKNPNDVYSFNGVGLMLEGELHGGPSLFVRGDGSRFVYSYMYQGRPQGEGIWFRADGFKAHVSNPRLKSDVSGEAFYIGEFDDGKYHGSGKFFFTKGYVFTGLWDRDLMYRGEMIRLMDDGSLKVYKEIYDVDKDLKAQKLAMNQHPVMEEILEDKTEILAGQAIKHAQPSIDTKSMAAASPKKALRKKI